MSNITAASSFIEEMLGDIKQELCDLYPFIVRVGVVKMAAPRHERFEYLREMGASDIDRVFHGKPFGKDTLTFFFPERHMSVHEQYGFMSVLTRHPHVDEITNVDIITSSPILIGNFYANSIRILTWPDDKDHNEEAKW